MQRLSYPTETVFSNKITMNRIVLSFKDSPRKQLGRRPQVHINVADMSNKGEALSWWTARNYFSLPAPFLIWLFLRGRTGDVVSR